MMQLKFLLLLLYSVLELEAVELLMSCTSSLKLLESEHPSNITSATGTTHLAIGVNYHYKRGEIYFSDGQGHLNRAWLRGENVNKDPIIIAEVVVVDGIAIDWINDNLYWTDFKKKTIEMATLDGLNQRVLFDANDDVDKPRAIVVDPSEGLLFWSDWGKNGEVLSSGLDGKRKKTVSSNFIWPNGLTLDLDRKKLYILDGLLSKLSSCNYDGSNFEDLFRSSTLVQQAFDLTYYSNKLYWTSWIAGAVISLDIDTEHTAVVYKHNKIGVLIERLMGLKAVHTSLQPEMPQASSCNVKNCSHQCIPSYQGTASCICPFGFTLGHDEKTCVEEGYMIVSWRKTIRRFDLLGGTPQSLLDSTKAAISIDVHLEKRFVFWSDIEEHRIYRAPLEQLNNKTIVVAVETCDGLVVDWVHDVLYWTDVNRNILEAASLDGSHRTALITEDLDHPRALALDPLEGILFWSDWGTNPKIESAHLDGSNRNIIVKNDIIWPNGITIDFDQKRLYWTDGMLKMISSSLYDGSERRQVLRSQIVSLQPFGISLLEDYLYWTDWSKHTLMKTLKHTVTTHTTTMVLANSSSLILRPNGIKIVHSRLQRKQDNPCKTMNCEGLCLGSRTSPKKVRCMGTEVKPDISIKNEGESEFNELDDKTISVNNNSFQLSFSRSKIISSVIIMWKCMKREGCSVDTRCSESGWKTATFERSEMPFTVTGLLPASKYEVKCISSSGVEEFHVTTINTDPPELPNLKSVDVKGSNVTLKWDPVDTCVPNFKSYKYRIYKDADSSELVLEGSTNLTEITLNNLLPVTSYKVHLFTLKPTYFVSTTFDTQAEELVECQKDELICDGKKDCTDGRDEDVNICAGIKNLIVHKKTNSEVYFRCIVTNKTAEQIVKFSGNYSVAESDLEEYFESPAIPCIVWTDSYCFNISTLNGSKLYTFNVSAVVRDGAIGNPVSALVFTKEGVPGPPEDLHLVSYTPTSVEIQWRHPNQSNGVLRSFIINIHEVEMFEEDKCCQSFPMTEVPVQEEQPTYSAKPGGFSPASTYAISITTKTLYLGGSTEIDVNTPPPPMDILRMPELEVSSLTPISWKPREETPADQPQYHPLIKSYLLLVIASKADQQLPFKPNNSIEVGPLKTLLEEKIGAEFLVLWNKNSDDAVAFKEPIRVAGLPPHKEYELVWVQVSQYKDVYGLDHVLSDPFIAV